ncbi:hypothetical protein FB451DRAFT_1023816, partial [Mycena latifolia]
LRHLFCFTSLVSLSTYTPAGLDLDDATVIDMARSWPDLQKLWVQPDDWERPPCATLVGLRALAQHCPHLHTIGMAFDASTIPSPVTAFDKSEPVLRDSPFDFCIGTSPISEALPVARFLSPLFPNLVKVETELDHHLEIYLEQERLQYPVLFRYQRLWKEVEAFLPQLKNVQTEEES